MRPLEGITVLDFTQAYSGPYCANESGRLRRKSDKGRA